MNRAPVTTQLGQLESAGLIRLAAVQPELEYVFKHILVKDAAYASLVKGDRRGLHRLTAESLERLYLASGEQAPAAMRPSRAELLPLLAHHLAEAGEPAPAARYYTQAGDAAARVYANAEAIHHYTRALDLRLPLPGEHERLAYLYTRRGRLYELTGQQPAALQNYLDLEALGHARGQPALVLTALSLRATLLAIPSVVTDPAQAFELAQTALRMARDLGDQATEARVLWTLMLAEVYLARPAQGIVCGEQALALARALGLREQVALVLKDLGHAHQNLGNLAAAREVAEEARRLWQAEGNLSMLAETTSSLANLAFFEGEFGTAYDLLRESLALSTTTGDAWGQSYSLLLISFVHIEQGRLDEAFAAAAECLRQSALSGFFYPQIVVRVNLALVHSVLGHTGYALTLAHEALALVDTQYVDVRYEVEAVLARLYGDLGDWDRSAHYNEAARAGYADRVELAFAPLIVAATEVRMALARHDPERAAAAGAQAAAAHAQTGLKSFLAEVMLQWARALRRLGRTEEAHEVLRQILALVQSQGSRLVLWQVLAEQAALAGQAGDIVRASALRAEAKAVIDFIGAHLSNPELHGSFLSTPGVRAVLEPQGSGPDPSRERPRHS